MKVLVVALNYAPEPTGIAPYVTALSRGLVGRGHDVRVLTTMPHYPSWRVRPGYDAWRIDDVVDGVAVTRLQHYVPRHPSRALRLLSEVTFGLRVLTTEWHQPDIVLFVSPALFSTAIAQLRTRVQRRPSIVWVQDLYGRGLVETGTSPRGAMTRLITAIESRVLTSATAVSVIHQRLAQIVQQLGVAPQKTAVIRNWTHLPERRPGARDAARRRLGWRDDEVIVLHSGAIGRKQDLDNVVEAARLAARRGTGLRFVLMGDGEERARLESAGVDVAGLGFCDPLPQDDFQEALGAADVLLVNEHPGLRDMAVPSKLTSYFSSGRPIVAATSADSTTAAELRASGAGVRVDARRPEQIVDAVLALSRDPELAERLGKAGRAYQRAVLTEQAALDHHAAWLEDVARSAVPATERRHTLAVSRPPH